MRVSTAGRYALRAMLDLALYGQEGPILRHEIAGRQEISGEYIAQLFRQLNRVGLIRSVMGPGGGYLLARSAEAISVREILEAVEGPFAAVFCVLPEGEAGSEKVCSRMEHCAAHVLWGRLTRVIEEYLGAVSLHDLCVLARQLELQGETGCADPVGVLLSPLPEPVGCPGDFAI